MYNESRKVEFINNYTKSNSTKKVCIALFGAIEQHEQREHMDVCEFGHTKLQSVVNDVVGFRARSKWLRMYILRDYCKWCVSMNVPNANLNIMDIQTTSVEKMRHMLVANPTHLQRCLDEIYEPESVKSTDNIRRCFYWLAYSGMPEEDIFKVKVSDVDFENMVVVFNNVVYPIYREAIPALKNCVELTMFKYIHPNYPPDKDVWRPRAEGNTLIRGIKSIPTMSSFRVDLSRTVKTALDAGKTQTKLSYYRAWLSGLFYRTLENERAGIPADFSDAATDFMEGKTYKLDSGRNTPEAKRRQIARDYLEDYQRWKFAFSI